MGGVGMKTSKVWRLKTKSAAHIVIRNGSGNKLFEIDSPCVCITVTVRSSATIEVEPIHEEMR